jgi:hypothetical protein
MNKTIYHDFQESVINIYVEHAEIKRIWERLDRNRWILRKNAESDDSPIHLFIEGKPGSGKTQLAKKYLRQNRGVSIIDEDKTELVTKPVLYMTLPVPFTYKGFYSNIIRSIEPDFPIFSQSVDTLKYQAFSLMKDHKVEMFIIDEMDYQLASTFVQKRAVMENIKDIANSAGVCLVCIGTNAIEELRILNTQHIRRYPKTILNHFKSFDTSFLDFLGEIEKQLKLTDEFALGWSSPNNAFAETLFNFTGGLVGFIKPIILEVFDLIGVFDKKFSDFSKLQLIDGNIIDQAQKNVIGELAEEDIEKIINSDR